MTQKNTSSFSPEELQTIEYPIKLPVYHGIPEINETTRLSFILTDAVFKSEALFYAITNLSKMATAGSHKVDVQELFHTFDALGQIGKSIVAEIINIYESLETEYEKSGGQE